MSKFGPKSIVNAKQWIGMRSSSMKRRSSLYGNRSAPRFLPTYRLEPKKPINRDVCEAIIKSVMDSAFEELKTYNPKTAPQLCQSISEEIRSRVKMENYDRYKLVCVVTIGEKFMQSFDAVAKFLWDSDHDGYVSYVYDTPNFFAIGTLYALYFD